MQLIKTALVTTALVLATCFVIAKIFPNFVGSVLSGQVPTLDR